MSCHFDNPKMMSDYSFRPEVAMFSTFEEFGEIFIISSCLGLRKDGSTWPTQLYFIYRAI